MAKLLVHITCGPNDPTRAALAFLVARTAQEEGHSVTLFLAGDAVQLLRPATLDALQGLGTGKLREHYDALRAGAALFYLSGMSSAARGLAVSDLMEGSFELVKPDVLVRLTFENDRVLSY